MAKTVTRRAFARGSLALGLAACSETSTENNSSSSSSSGSTATPDVEAPGTPAQILAGMSLDEKISQLIIPSVDTAGDEAQEWDGMGVTDLDAVPPEPPSWAKAWTGTDPKTSVAASTPETSLW